MSKYPRSKNILISTIGVREKFFNNLLNEIKIHKAFEISHLVGGLEHFKRTSRIGQINIPSCENEFIDSCKDITHSKVIIYLGRKNSINVIEKAINFLSNNQNTIIIINEKKFGRHGLVLDPIKHFTSYFIGYFNNKNCSINYLITNSRSRNLRAIQKFKPRNILDCCYFDCIKDNCKTNENVGLYLDSFFPYGPLIQRKCGNSFYFDPDKYYLSIVNFLLIQKKRLKLEKIQIKRHPNSDGSELKYFERFEILPLDCNFDVINRPKFCWSSGSDATIPYHMSGVETYFITPLEAIRCEYYKKYYYSKSVSLGIENIFINFDGVEIKKKRNMLRSIFMGLQKNIFKILHVKYNSPSSVIILKKILKN